MDQEIIDFIKGNHVATICCADGDAPYCFSCFYALLERENCLVFKSSFGTKHGKILETNNKVAGSILPDEINTAVICGLQFEGTAKESSELSTMHAAAAYYGKYPIAMAMPGKIWIVELQSLKYTDNAKGFGYKNTWKK